MYYVSTSAYAHLVPNSVCGELPPSQRLHVKNQKKKKKENKYDASSPMPNVFTLFIYLFY